MEGLRHCADRTVEMCNQTCPYYRMASCETELAADVMELIKELQEEIENLKQILQSVMEGVWLVKAQELVRCKDCKHRGTYDCPVYVGGDGMCSEPDEWYCAGGERRKT